ncbi:hypothetical protein SteCoe_20220 [Stentor coeruleus]|uniref:Uncharacterized protein n=1 Tax=Stentor coeruleus TaxID=5963 RepID=A0A1R2BSM5_9CILI|nr:hypothetical protein SteCoe_20220 [Stentor coeruleus]
MDIHKELDLYLTSMHPLLNLGSEVLKNIKYTDPPGSKNNAFIASLPNLDANLHTKSHKKQRKRQKKARQPSSSPIGIPAKRVRNSLCPCCEWVFPFKYSKKDISTHINSCLDGQEQQDISNYTKKHQKRKSNKTPTSKKEHKRQSDPQTLTNSQNPTPKQKTFIKKCQNCNLNLNSRTENFIKHHLEYCKTEQALYLSHITRPKISLDKIFDQNFIWY